MEVLLELYCLMYALHRTKYTDHCGVDKFVVYLLGEIGSCPCPAKVQVSFYIMLPHVVIWVNMTDSGGSRVVWLEVDMWQSHPRASGRTTPKHRFSTSNILY